MSSLQDLKRQLQELDEQRRGLLRQLPQAMIEHLKEAFEPFFAAHPEIVAVGIGDDSGGDGGRIWFCDHDPDLFFTDSGGKLFKAPDLWDMCVPLPGSRFSRGQLESAASIRSRREGVIYNAETVGEEYTLYLWELIKEAESLVDGIGREILSKSFSALAGRTWDALVSREGTIVWKYSGLVAAGETISRFQEFDVEARYGRENWCVQQANNSHFQGDADRRFAAENVDMPGQVVFSRSQMIEYARIEEPVVFGEDEIATRQ